MSEEARFFVCDRNAIKQQQLKAIQPILTPVVIVITLVITGIIFIVLGVVILDDSKHVVEYVHRYDNLSSCQITSSDSSATLPKECSITFTIERTMKPPIYFYYEIHRYYQNHRRYLQSRSDVQLENDDLSSVSTCDPYERYQGVKLYPCGMVAQTFFSDRFRMTVNGNDLCNSTTHCKNYGMNNATAWRAHWHEWSEEPYWSTHEIAWKSDRDDKFIYNPQFNQSGDTYTVIGEKQDQVGLRLPTVNNSDLIVWMRNAALPNFRKLHRIIRDKTLEPGDTVNVTILNWFFVDETDSEKYIVLTTTKWLGGQNYFLAWTYVGVGCSFIALAVVFTIVLLIGKRSLKKSVQAKNAELMWG